jgi:hypothetical protein
MLEKVWSGHKTGGRSRSVQLHRVSLVSYEEDALYNTKQGSSWSAVIHVITNLRRSRLFLLGSYAGFMGLTPPTPAIQLSHKSRVPTWTLFYVRVSLDLLHLETYLLQTATHSTTTIKIIQYELNRVWPKESSILFIISTTRERLKRIMKGSVEYVRKI